MKPSTKETNMSKFASLALNVGATSRLNVRSGVQLARTGQSGTGQLRP
jgi:hypothetical protein